MKLLLDTHIFLWALAEPEKLSASQRDKLESAANMPLVSSVSIAEIQIKTSLGKLVFDFNPVEAVEACGFMLLDFSAEDALPLKTLPFHHRDPFDRMLIAQSITRQLSIMTNDPQFARYGCRLIG